MGIFPNFRGEQTKMKHFLKPPPRYLVCLCCLGFVGWYLFILNKNRIEAWHSKQPCWNGCFFSNSTWIFESSKWSVCSFSRDFCLGGSRLKAKPTMHGKWVNLANDETMETSDSGCGFCTNPSACFFFFNMPAWTNHQIRSSSWWFQPIWKYACQNGKKNFP